MQFIIVFLIILTFIKPFLGSIIFIVFVSLMEIWVLLANNSKIKVKNTNNEYNMEEIMIIERYHLFFRYPFAAKILSPMFSGIQLSVFLLVPWLFYKGLILQALFIGANYFISSQLAVILNPQFFLHDNLDKGKIKDPIMLARYTKDMNTIDSAVMKMFSPKSL